MSDPRESGEPAIESEPAEHREDGADAAASEPAEPAAPRRLELVISGEHGLSDPPPPPRVSVPAEPAAAFEPASATRVPFGAGEVRMLRSLAGWVGLTGVATLGVCAVFVSQWASGHGTVPSAMAAVLAGAIGLWSVLAGWHFGRVARRGDDDAHQLVSAFSHLRSILILKAVGLFLVLGLSCFVFSIVASLLALL